MHEDQRKPSGFLEYEEKTPPEKELSLESLKLEAGRPYKYGSE